MLRFAAMTTPLADIIRADIRDNGPMDFGRYMGLCLGHPVHGYYMTHDPFGAAGDFTTAPEISQLFGELIGAWIADLWVKNGRYSPFRIVEFGPGRGSLMADLMRVTRSVPGFHDAVHIHLIEMSPVLRDKQKDALGSYRVTWHDDLDSVPEDGQIMILGNEFLDALPVRRLIYKREGWAEEVVGLDPKGDFTFGLRPADPALVAYLPRMLIYPQEYDRIEISPVLNQNLKCTYNRMQKQNGIALFLDYGYPQSSYGDTVQAVQKHHPVSLFHEPGRSDITAHVNFETVGTLAMESGLTIHGPARQGDFLNRLGIHDRMAVLHRNATDRQKIDLQNSINRLVSYDQMGRLFKVMAITADPMLTVEGFA